MFLILHSIPNPNLGNCVRIVEINDHQLRVKCTAATRISNCNLSYPLRQKHARFELLCRILHRSCTEKLHQLSDNEVTEEWTSKPDVATSSRMLLVLVVLLRNKPRLFLPLRLGVSVNPDELNSTIGRGGIHLHPAISH